MNSSIILSKNSPYSVCAISCRPISSRIFFWLFRANRTSSPIFQFFFSNFFSRFFPIFFSFLHTHTDFSKGESWERSVSVKCRQGTERVKETGEKRFDQSERRIQYGLSIFHFFSFFRQSSATFNELFRFSYLCRNFLRKNRISEKLVFAIKIWKSSKKVAKNLENRDFWGKKLATLDFSLKLYESNKS